MWKERATELGQNIEKVTPPWNFFEVSKRYVSQIYYTILSNLVKSLRGSSETRLKMLSLYIMTENYFQDLQSRVIKQFFHDMTITALNTLI